ncbi:MAG: superoxide dismutase [Cyclobacteriaceae bacterium]|nr:superoxide dismutase [Cyclobacteriaceae bacterium]
MSTIASLAILILILLFWSKNFILFTTYRLPVDSGLVHLSSHILHTIFWTNLTNKKTEPSGALLRQIEKDFGTYDKLKSLMAKTAKGVDGNGWGILGYLPATEKLTVLQCENHEKLTQWGVIPVLVIDVWEHSYYLKYRNRRTEFVDNLFSILNWDNVAERFAKAVK